MSDGKNLPDESRPMHVDHDRPEPQARAGGTSMYHNDERKKKRARRLRNWKIATFVFMALSACLAAAVIAVAAVGHSSTTSSAQCVNKTSGAMKQEEEMSKKCTRKVTISPGKSKIFSGLSMKEFDEVVKFMKKDLKLVDAANATTRSDYIYTVEDYLPKKQDVLQWLDGKRRDQPERQARVIVFRGSTRKVEDYLVSPIPKPKRKVKVNINRKSGVDLSWKSRPVCNVVEAPELLNFVTEELERNIETIYLRSFSPNNKCKKVRDCMYANVATRAVIGSPDRYFIVWFFASPKHIVDYYLYALPFYLIVSVPANGYNFQIRDVYYNNMRFDSLKSLKDKYFKDKSMNYKLPPIDKSPDAYGSPQYAPDENSEDTKHRPPAQYYPDGERFHVAGQRVQWLDWEFDIHSRGITGMQLFNVRHEKKRIAYELSMQDIVVLYSGNAPDDFFKNYFDNGWSIGRYNMPLIRGVDCPSGATYLNSSVYAVGEDKGVVLDDTICVFEHRNAVPMRHHYSSKFFEWGYRFAFSMPDSVLIIRQILTVWNYDYIFDYEFHQNGMVELKVSSTGYIAVTTNIPSNTVDRGLVVNPKLNAVANLHQHLFNFKLDVDVDGVNNNFKTINIKSQRTNSKYAQGQPWYQMVADETEILKESDAALTYDFDQPKQYVIYNKNSAVYSGSPQKKGYRVASNSFSKVVMPHNWPMLSGGASWAKYQLAVTKYDDNERSTASLFVQGDPFDPAVSFDDFRTGDARLNNVDLVTWVTVGLHHLPTYEDLPVTTTPGKTLSIALIPFNYSKRDPSIQSRDAAVFWSKSMNKTDDFLYQNATCPVQATKPMIAH